MESIENVFEKLSALYEFNRKIKTFQFVKDKKKEVLPDTAVTPRLTPAMKDEL